ncbi:hypothetical protein [Corynebacterium sp. TAE3-ERU16]|uniref:hypothetical protein n=1 Tax=Corynebacterium sp. TAE3-ERU16 TaxID=2849493 RepID=UPI001C492B00|nr:hypothetical protein [Corynebacterium sp. TAE3-ERU16]MBV7292334.1 hypothetical protein [Corynebacterium sp. TAE3-ERU16]
MTTITKFTIEQVNERLDKIVAQFADVTTKPAYDDSAELRTFDDGDTRICGYRNRVAGDMYISVSIHQKPADATHDSAQVTIYRVDDEGHFHRGLEGWTEDEIFPDRHLAALKAFITGGAK